MKKNHLIKGLTLLTFVLLLSVFILYRMDVWNPTSTIPEKQLIINSLTDNTANTAIRDTITPLRFDSNRRTLMSSSKSLVVMKEQNPYLDSVLKRKGDSLSKKKWMMSSSKSAIIIKPSAVQKVTDSIKPHNRKYKTVKQ